MVINDDKNPCIDCLVLPSCRERITIECSRLYYWITTIDKMYEAQILLPKPIVLPEPSIPKEGQSKRDYSV